LIRAESINDTLSLGTHPAFLRAQSLVRDALCRHFGEPWDAVAERLAAGANQDLRTDFALMVQLENCLLELMPAATASRLKSIQFPANVRIVQAAPATGYLARPFATDYVHCDVWSGAPADSLNVFLYLDMQGDCARLKLFKSIEADPYARDYRGPYAEFKGDLSRLDEVTTPAAPGIMHIFSTYCPHKTVRGASGLRLSIDFRVRTGAPYLLDGRPLTEQEFSSYSPGFPGQGIYWTKPTAPLASFADKCRYEIEQARAVGPWAVSLRESYINKITAKGVFA